MRIYEKHRMFLTYTVLFCAVSHRRRVIATAKVYF